MDILQEVLSSMPQCFSSNHFSNCAKKKGFPQYQINNGAISSFLRKYAFQSKDSRRTWSKIKTNFDIDTDIKIAIDLLKKNGYKIFKSVTEYKEI